MTKLALNARFLAQDITGVQRFCRETATALAALRPVELLAPAGWLRGQAWEQFFLPRRAGGRVLLNLGNTAPLAVARQVVVIHDAATFAVPESYAPGFRAWYRLLHRALARRGATIATVSGFARGEIARHLGLDPAAIAVLGEGAEHMLRPPADPGLPARLGLERPYVLAVGSPAPHKNLAALSATAAMLAARGAELVLTGDLSSPVFARIALPAPARRVGRVDDASLRALYEGAACLVFPSRHEGFGLPAVEAMALGCPVVAARAGALPEVCAGAALFADPADPLDIAQAVAAVLDDPALAARLAAAGRVRAAGFTWAATAARLSGLVDAVARGDKGP
jgi:glycosyltransferase involved in cell wall biosynthesis